MRLTYSSQDKVAYLYLTEIAEGEIAEAVHIDDPKIKAGMVFDLDKNGHILGIEFLSSKSLPIAALEKAQHI
jgi:uncharacterized protein YuzE